MKLVADAVVQHWKESPKYRLGLVLALLQFLFRSGVNFSWHMEWLVVKGWPTKHVCLEHLRRRPYRF